eukprot:8383761-Pyramimonas_sp.AAC.1
MGGGSMSKRGYRWTHRSPFCSKRFALVIARYGDAGLFLLERGGALDSMTGPRGRAQLSSGRFGEAEG